MKSMPFDRDYPFAVFFSEDKENWHWFNAFCTRKSAIKIAREGLTANDRARFAIVVDMRNKSTIRRLQAPKPATHPPKEDVSDGTHRKP